MFWQSPSSPTSKSPLRNASAKGPVGSTRWVTLRPILLHWSMTHVPLNLYGWSTLRLSNSKVRFSAPASFNSRLASARDFSISGQKPAPPALSRHPPSRRDGPLGAGAPLRLRGNRFSAALLLGPRACCVG